MALGADKPSVLVEGEGLAQLLIAALGVGTVDHTVLFIDAVFQHDDLRKGLPVLFLRNEAVLTHCPEHVFLTGFIIFVVLIGIVISGAVGNADQACALRKGQLFQLLAEISFRRAAHALAVLPQVNEVQVVLHNGLLAVTLFHLHSTEDLQHLTANGNVVSGFILRKKDVLDKLLGNAGAAHRVVAKEHSGTRLDGGDPVNTLVLTEAVVLNGNGSIDKILGNIVVACPFTAGPCVKLLQDLNVSVFIHII